MGLVKFINTPIEKYYVNGHDIFVKREDLCALSPMPPLAKLRGIYKYLEKFPSDYLIGVLDTRISKSGSGVAVICKDLGLRCRHYFPLKKGESIINEQRKISVEMGAELKPMAAAALRFVYAKAKKDIEKDGGYMLPHGLPFFETVKEIAEVLLLVTNQYLNGSIIMSTGTATIMSGILCGLIRKGILPEIIIGVSAGMSIKKQHRTIRKHIDNYILKYDIDIIGIFKANNLLNRVQLYHSERDYYDPSPVDIPFPMHLNYEGKAWEYLLSNLNNLPEPILFWNIGS